LKQIRTLSLLVLSMSGLCLSHAAVSGTAEQDARQMEAAAGQAPGYRLDYEGQFQPSIGTVEVRLTVRQDNGQLKSVRFGFDTARYRDFEADGILDMAEEELSWQPPADGGSLRFTLDLNHQRKGGGFDSLMQENWAIFRGDDLLPPVATTARKGAHSRSRLRLAGPDGWSFATAYPRAEDDPQWFIVDRPGRRFDRPVGWMAAGRLGARWGDIAGTRVGVAGPVGQGVRRLDMQAFLRWNLPALKQVFPDFPNRLLVVAAGDPMWRGGLSGPGSLYVHADRPLISENGTSTLLHELVHVAQGFRATEDEDWIVEGIAEYYTLEIMRRSGTISENRYERGMEKLAQWGSKATGLTSQRSTGARTARAAVIMRELDTELRDKSSARYSLDDVARQLVEDGEPVSLSRLRTLAEQLAGGPVLALSPQRLDEA
jgi:hypothetical protein